MVAPVRFGIVGLGWVARDYMLPALAAAGERVRLTAVVSLRPEDFAGLAPEVARFGDLTELLAADLVDAVYVATPNHLHRAQAVACLRAGVHVLCEKPLALTQDAVGEMRRAALDNDRWLVTAYDQRHHPAHRRMRELLRTGRLGTITQARIDYACWVPADWSGDNWRIDPGRAGGGAVIDLAPHGLDLLAWLLDDEITAVHCFLQNAVHGYGVDDGGVLSLSFAGGALATVTVAYNRPETLPRRRLEIMGTGGVLLAENTMGQTAGGALSFVDARTGRATDVPFPPREGPFGHQLLHFLDRLATNPGHQPDLRATQQQVALLMNALERAALPGEDAEPAVNTVAAGR